MRGSHFTSFLYIHNRKKVLVKCITQHWFLFKILKLFHYLEYNTQDTQDIINHYHINLLNTWINHSRQNLTWVAFFLTKKFFDTRIVPYISKIIPALWPWRKIIRSMIVIWLGSFFSFTDIAYIRKQWTCHILVKYHQDLTKDDEHSALDVSSYAWLNCPFASTHTDNNDKNTVFLQYD